MKHRRGSVSGAASLILVVVLLAGCGPGADEKRQAEENAERERQQIAERAAREAERAGELEKSMQSLSEMAVAELRASLDKTQATLRRTAGFAVVKDDLERLTASLDHLQAIQTSAREARAAGILEPALAGFAMTDAIMTGRSVKARAAIDQLTELLIRGDASARELEKQNREMTIQSAMVDMTKGPFEIFAVSIAALARNGPPDLRRSTFESVAAAIPQAGYGRPTLEQALRICYEQEDDEPARSRFAATMATLAVPLTAPAADPPAAAAGTP